MALPPRNMDMVQDAIHRLLLAIGEDPQREGLRDTPLRVAKMYSEVLDGNFSTMKDMTSFTEETYGGMVMVHHIPFYSLCEHHLCLFQGTFGMAYIPDKKLLGISKLVRIFRHFCKRPTVQERITEQSVDALMRIAGAKGAIAYVKADHTCMTLRGVKSPGALTTTVAFRGALESSPELRQTFLQEASK